MKTQNKKPEIKKAIIGLIILIAGVLLIIYIGILAINNLPENNPYLKEQSEHIAKCTTLVRNKTILPENNDCYVKANIEQKDIFENNIRFVNRKENITGLIMMPQTLDFMSNGVIVMKIYPNQTIWINQSNLEEVAESLSTLSRMYQKGYCERIQ